MTYTEWRDELKSNLLCVFQSEQKRVLEYYAEAYADRREAGYSEREIIEQFGAPYDAAQRILNEDGRRVCGTRKEGAARRAAKTCTRARRIFQRTAARVRSKALR